jgi:hypothetical protein
MGYFSACCGIVFEDYSRGGSSRSIPLTDMDVAAMVEPTVTEKSPPKRYLSSVDVAGYIVRGGHHAEYADDKNDSESESYFSCRAADQLLNRARAKVSSSDLR